ncbi:myb-related transcription factor, partner of profilin isoform X1 [Sinocyclocheilus anshuiensis]|uniref:Myb-related transcription factor, partner of profilin-like n=1 Tax=Sinocyclocheilus anshuiensis TaxID=1608454 RepID=A0A671Q5V1_9TELE|nr:PREDICTED: myb-related transcription factor, partner of profilin-like isoform X1 [Sinocyclocheilus anshuiensis]XP_016356278.1 PREDICTED: myb-related transcription factor, partner of profilin-like isoform X1 [Sinocyclocheilus anshuiensis]XP_016356279.1 PREDICTED: myb-related transcription factor, partner of profilin-like isoform X1 [Sinocyclocheilus anshuiensis]
MLSTSHIGVSVNHNISMTEYYEEGGLLYEHSPPMHIKVESPEGPFGCGVSEDGFPREDEDSEGSCDHENGGLPSSLPFNVVVVHPNIVAPGMSSDELIPIEQNRGVPSALTAGGVGKRKSRFSGAELEVLVSEVTRCEGELFGPAGRLRRRERERIWAGILERVNAVSRVPRTLREVKKRWDDLKRRNGGRLADARHRTCYLPSSRGAAILGRPTQVSPRLQQSRQKQSTRGKASFTCLSDTDPVVVGDSSERDGFEKEDEAGEQEGEDGDDCEGVENSMEDKLGLGLGLGIVPPPTSERWLPPSPLYSAPFLNGTPQPSPEPSLGTHQGPLEPPPPCTSWLEDELRGLGEAAMQLGDRMEQNLREFGEGFRSDMRTLVASQEALTNSLQQNNVLLQRLLGLLEMQHQPPQQQIPQQQLQQQQQQLQQPAQHQQQQEPPQQQPYEQLLLPQEQPQLEQQITATVPPLPPPPDILDGTRHTEPPNDMNGVTQQPRRGRTVDLRRRRRR